MFEPTMRLFRLKRILKEKVTKSNAYKYLFCVPLFDKFAP
jgi:hypothetical protein